ncbi:MAG: ABC transporter permease [Planctomycetota bacterium]
MTRLDWIVPGLGHLRLGFRREAAKYLFFLGLWLAAIVCRRERLLELGRGPKSAEVWVAFGFLAAWPLLWMLAARTGLRRLLAPARRDSLSPWRIAMGMMRRNARAVWGMRVLGVAYMVAFLCPVLAPYDPEATPSDTIVNKQAPPFSTIYVLGDLKRGEIYCRDFRLEEDGRLFLDRAEEFAHRRVPFGQVGEPKGGWKRPPTGARTLGGRDIPYRAERHLLGTDELGRDLLSALIYGSRISLSIGFVAMAIAVVIGALVGVVSGYLGGWIDFTLMRCVDVLLAFPRLLLLLLIYSAYAAAKLEASIFLVVAVLGGTGWMGISRLVRAQILSLREQDFAVAAQALGLRKGRIMSRHLLPNAVAPIIVDATLRVGDTILTEAALSFLGMGVQKPTPSWGNIVEGGAQVLYEAWWIATLPGVAIVFVVVSFNLVGDALRDALDPKLRH